LPRKILVIEDDAQMARALEIRLRAAGYEPSLASDGFEGLWDAHLQKPDVILLDIVLPGMDGFEVKRRLTAALELSDVPVVFLTSDTREETRMKARAVGGMCFLSKPCDADLLLAVIETAVTRAGKNRPKADRIRSRDVTELSRTRPTGSHLRVPWSARDRVANRQLSEEHSGRERGLCRG
jgi:DNA-binding response OmpR family regulator